MPTDIAPDVAGESLQRAREDLRYEEVIGRVQREAGLLTPAAAALAARATLRTLAERLRAAADDVEEKLAADELIASLFNSLPGQFSHELYGDDSAGGIASSADERSREEFSTTEFFQRVAERTGIGLSEAERHVRAVAIALDAAVSGTEVDRVRSRLPDEFEFLFV